ncbi:hypothetical protein [Bosea sp. (in: a-proteobacteria)]|jgi:hypothetical protein|uniref:hypothetical protein n=1 Tax=Bosea sp. (in: a-proteobacteria) TaxID=1871050 RepID=UPI002DDCFD0D|nr:hypothetical protein [Bosea sp. (in: a-proteobacteria)]HEV2513299.1 hypothetical protein [Bosea sp. (in: a-proteobacteria)]
MRDAIESASGDGKAVVARNDAGLTIDTAHWTLTSAPPAVPGRSKAPDSRQDMPGKSDRPDHVPLRRRFIPLACGVAAAILLLLVPRNANRPEPGRLREPAPVALPAGEASDTAVMARELAEARGAIAALKAQLQSDAGRNEQSLRQEQDKAAIQAQEAAAARQELVAAAAQHRQALDDERAQRAALADQLAASQRELQAQTAQLRSASDDIEQLKQLATATGSQSLEQERQKAVALAQELSAAQREAAAQAAQLRKAGEEAGQLRQAEAMKAGQALEQERQKTAAIAQATAARQALTTAAAQHRQALDEERGQRAALMAELAAARRENEAQAAQLRRAGEEAGQLRQAEAARTAQGLDLERQKAAALAQVAALRQEQAAGTLQYRQAIEQERAQRAALTGELSAAQREAEAQLAQLQTARGEAEKFKQASESTISDLRQALQQERDRAVTAAEELASLRAATVQPAAVPRETPKPPQAIVAGATLPPTSGEARNSPEAMRLIARASALLAQGDIGSARAVLERAADMGSARASFMLAETYDPRILSAWGTYGTRGEIARARELYARAQVGGIQEAKDRVDALPR